MHNLGRSQDAYDRFSAAVEVPLLVLAVPAICHPANWLGKRAELGAGSAAKTGAATAALQSKIRANLESRIEERRTLQH